jgi:hypothetical protein
VSQVSCGIRSWSKFDGIDAKWICDPSDEIRDIPMGISFAFSVVSLPQMSALSRPYTHQWGSVQDHSEHSFPTIQTISTQNNFALMNANG